MFDSTPMTLQLLSGMKLHTLIAAIFLQSKGLGRFGTQEVASVVGCSRKTARSHLQALKALGLVHHVGFKQKSPWMLNSEGVKQLPLPLQLDGGKSYPQRSPSPQSYPQEKPPNERVKGKSYPQLSTDPYRSDLDLEEEEEGKPYPQQSSHLLREIGCTGTISDITAAHSPAEILGAWWWLATQTWPRSKKAVLLTHLREGHVTPQEHIDFAHWWLHAPPPDRDQLTGAIQEAKWAARDSPQADALPYSFPQPLTETAVSVWTAKKFQL
jgi:hypothetical protein